MKVCHCAIGQMGPDEECTRKDFLIGGLLELQFMSNEIHLCGLISSFRSSCLPHRGANCRSEADTLRFGLFFFFYQTHRLLVSFVLFFFSFVFFLLNRGHTVKPSPTLPASCNDCCFVFEDASTSSVVWFQLASSTHNKLFLFWRT